MNSEFFQVSCYQSPHGQRPSTKRWQLYFGFPDSSTLRGLRVASHLMNRIASHLMGSIGLAIDRIRCKAILSPYVNSS